MKILRFILPALVVVFCTVGIQARDALEFKITSGRSLYTGKETPGDLRFRIVLDNFESKGKTEPMLMTAIYDHNHKEYVNSMNSFLNNRWEIVDVENKIKKGSLSGKSQLILATNTNNGLKAYFIEDFYDRNDNFVMLRLSVYDFFSEKETEVYTIGRQLEYPAFNGNPMGYIRHILLKARDMGIVTPASATPPSK